MVPICRFALSMNLVSVLFCPYRVVFIHSLLFFLVSFSLFYFHAFSHLAVDSLYAKRFYLQTDEELRVDRRDEEKKRAALAPDATATAARRACRLRGHERIYFNPLLSFRPLSPLFFEPYATTHLYLSLSLFSLLSFFFCFIRQFLKLILPIEFGGIIFHIV